MDDNHKNLPIFVIGLDSEGNTVKGQLSGTGGGKYTGVFTDWGTYVAVVKSTIQLDKEAMNLVDKPTA